MKFYDQMMSMAEKLTTAGFKVHTPTQEEILFHNMNEQEKVKAKKQYIQEHMERIRASDIVLIANFSKNGISGYIGPNTLIEIAFARAFEKPIYIIEEPGIQPCIDELRGFDLRLISDLSQIT